MIRIAFLFTILLIFPATTFAVPGRQPATNASSEQHPKVNEAELQQLLDEARELFQGDHPIDARAKLQKALQLAPNDYRPHLHLGEYYLSKVAHFSLAYRYLNKAEELFEKKFGSDKDNTLDPNMWREHARLLYVLAEAELNFDRYEEALDTLTRFGANYWDSWYPGTTAWVQMKLKNFDEGIKIAQAGLLRGAEPGRTYNILGILLSVTGHRNIALKAFARSIQAEFIQGSRGQAATPLNNAGEVYRELFKDRLAEASWVKALSLPDGCEHILPSLNLATLYIDELRLFQAERVLSDFEACFSQHSIRSDTEHRALIALSRGRIAFRKGDINKAISELTEAQERQQWFGKIGTNQNDVQFATLTSLSQALDAKISTIRDTAYVHFWGKFLAYGEIPWLELRSWWLARRARQIAIEELDDFEDLSIRHTDAMVEYPTMGSVLAGFPSRALRARINRTLVEDERITAHGYYYLYLGTNLLNNGDEERAIEFFNKARPLFRTFDRLAKAELLAQEIKAKNEEEITKIEELYLLLPSQVRYHGFYLPVSTSISGNEEVAEELLSGRFREDEKSTRFKLIVDDTSITLKDKKSNRLIYSQPISQKLDEEKMTLAVNSFTNAIFSHKVDPASEALPALPILSDLF